MREEDKTTVIDFTDNHKDAALFFDCVLPLNASIFKDEQNIYFLQKLLPPNYIIDYKKKILHFGGYFEISYLFIDSILSGKEQITGCSPDELLMLIKGAFGYPILYPFVANSLCNEAYNCTSLELAQLPLIDTSKSEWEQIIQIREDEDSINKLRNLRLFFHENYSGKEKSFVIDDLCKRYENYKNAIKDWGFETIISSIQMLLTSPVTLASVGSSLAIALYGEPLNILATAGTGATIEIGKMSLHIAKEKKKLSILQRDHPLAYIIDAKKKLE